MNIAIYGTGQFGTYIERLISENKKNVVKCFADSNSCKWGTNVNGLPVLSPSELQNKSKEIDAVLVCFMNSIAFFDEIVSLGKKCGFVRNRVFEAHMSLEDELLLDKNIVWSDAAYLSKPVLRSLETNIVDGCNLNCKGCSHFSNLFKRDDKVPFDVFRRDLKQVAEHTYIHRFNMLGGEALLNENIIDYIKYARRLLPYSEIELISNGLLIPSQSDAFFRCCEENDITISISGYRPTLRLKDKIKDVMDRYRIVYIFREDVLEFGKNIDLSGNADKQEAVKRCRENKCHFLRNGKIYKCPFEALGNVFFKHFGLDIRFDGGTDIYDEQLDWNKLIKRLYKEPVDACCYCGKEERIEWQVENHPVMSDWVVREE